MTSVMSLYVTLVGHLTSHSRPDMIRSAKYSPGEIAAKIHYVSLHIRNISDVNHTLMAQLCLSVEKMHNIVLIRSR